MALAPLVAPPSAAQKPVVRALVPVPAIRGQQPDREQPARPVVLEPIGGGKPDAGLVVLGAFAGALAIMGAFYLVFRWGRRSVAGRVEGGVGGVLEGLAHQYLRRRNGLRLVTATGSAGGNQHDEVLMTPGSLMAGGTGLRGTGLRGSGDENDQLRLPIPDSSQPGPWYTRMKIGRGLRRPRIYMVR